MKSKAFIALGSAVVASVLTWLAFVPSPAVGQTGKVATSAKFEYSYVGDIKNGFGEVMGTSVKALDEAGQEGWEAVAVMGGSVLMKRPLTK